MIIS
jgi:hypothetical protein